MLLAQLIIKTVLLWNSWLWVLDPFCFQYFKSALQALSGRLYTTSVGAMHSSCFVLYALVSPFAA